tara:strand:- start:133 stop:1071 length:939 start_codon:yes stop_codon:yes gene_type:complete
VKHLLLTTIAAVVLVGCAITPVLHKDSFHIKTPDSNKPDLEVLADTETFLITSKITGRTYQIFIALPHGYEKIEEPFPVIYGVDANGQFGTLVEASRLLPFEGYPKTIVISVGYPVGHFWDALPPRAIDLTPTFNQKLIDKLASDFPEEPAMEGSGGASGFLRFLEEELFTFIEFKYKASPENRTLYGHSFGGLFGTYALFKGNQAFTRFIIGSPSYWWDEKVSFQFEEEYAKANQNLNAKVFFSTGMLEEKPGDEVMAPFNMVSNLRAFLSALKKRGYKGLNYKTVFFPQENHLSVIPPTISRGLRFVFDQ